MTIEERQRRYIQRQKDCIKQLLRVIDTSPGAAATAMAVEDARRVLELEVDCCVLPAPSPQPAESKPCPVCEQRAQFAKSITSGEFREPRNQGAKQ